MPLPFIARNSPWRVAGLLLLGLGFVFIGAWIAGLAGPPPRPGMTWLGWVGIVFFGACTVKAVPRLFDRSVLVRIDAQGVTVAQWSSRRIDWHRIERVGTWSHRGQRMLVLHLKQPAQHAERRLAAPIAAANRALTGGDVAITLTGTDRTFEEAFRAVSRFSPIAPDRT